MARIFGSLLGTQWSFVKVAAILPSVVNEGKACKECKKYILTEDYDIKAVSKEIGLFDTKQDMKDSSYDEFVALFEEIINFSSITKRVVPSFHGNTFEQVFGKTEHELITQGVGSMGAGYTAPTGPSTSTDQHPIFDEIRKMPNTAGKVLYLNNDQLGLLSKNGPKRLVFLTDFGSGTYKYILNNLFVIKRLLYLTWMIFLTSNHVSN